MRTFAILLLFLDCFSSLSQDLPEGFDYLDNLAPGIKVDLRYNSRNNFMGRVIEGYEANRCITTKEAGMALGNIQSELEKVGYGLIIYDAYRPQRAVDHFVSWSNQPSDTTNKRGYYPDIAKGRLIELGYISARSGHTRGSTVDLSLINLNTNEPLDMGSGWDFFGEVSWPDSQEVNTFQRQNRNLLRTVMIKYGFLPYDREWWHFTLKDEPFPDTYFDFVVK